ncbi:SagB/ThcOx family dehydrogenase [Nostoc sp. UCD121]|uniref:SagB/ThcOx family dehydrogenase n=1 Tax=unclassified Nostoc TaxID=2593658 RepID=UPI00162489F6|nr:MULTISPECIES: SagB/ThcOx family dehydrogenase [unclassified Nostoc]MBC1222099.1 SagB/ThcOx family dehydrogenase [Nostoc sp. UCD120]MBC1278669.1 SagB/ThcOx family dehydrogenase [Nostoc sp. UCD121]MBC1299390.1 SagB/ThcOx family dehydrogenase [Nostoc sp. UCD122]
MPSNQISSKAYHDATKHSSLSVQLDPNYVDASTQPSAFKVYPKFYRRVKLNLNNPVHSFISLTSAITLEKMYKDGPYQLRVNPSAGALYPTEVYVQVRGVEGVVNGIYHLEVENNCLTLIYELIDDGLENYIIPGKSISGFIFLISCVYYRSSWKYQNRSIRYCFLDSGHHLGAIAASAFLHNRDIQLIFDFDKLTLNLDLGFENKEFITACAVSGELEDKKIRSLRLKVPFVSGTDYFESNQFIEDAYHATTLQKSLQQRLEYPQFYFDRDKFYQTIWDRRSIRRFRKEAISQEDYLYVVQQLQQSIPTENYEEIEIYSVVHRVEGMTPGLYRGTHLVKAGNFSEKTGYLCINQAIARDGAVTLFFVSDYLNYQTAMQIAGFLGQRLYLTSNYLGIQCSGIGAYYDDETQELLETNKDVLYGMVIGI